MDFSAYAVRKFVEAAELLPREMRCAVLRLPEEVQAKTEEFRLRAGRGLTIACGDAEKLITNGQGLSVYQSDLDMVLEIATQSSVHTAFERLRNGFVTVRGGHRIGICGTAVLREGEIRTISPVSSLAIRIAREVKGAGEPLLPLLIDKGAFRSTLIVSVPGAGKTTLLRDIVRCLSGGLSNVIRPLRVGLADERSEVAAMYQGVPQMDVGAHTDVLDGCPKAAAMMMLLRGLNPHVLASDEITAPEDVSALEGASNCGVSLLATAHGAGREDLLTRPLYRGLLERRIFSRMILIRLKNGERVYEVISLEENPEENNAEKANASFSEDERMAGQPCSAY